MHRRLTAGSTLTRTGLDATFINYDVGHEKWKTGVQANSETLKRVIEGIRDGMHAFNQEIPGYMFHVVTI